MKATDFTRGMTIISRDNVYVGQVVEVWAETAAHGCLPVTRHLLADYGPVKGTADLLGSGDGYLHVRQGDFMGFGGRDRYVPFSAVGRVDSTSATLKQTAAVCEERSSFPPYAPASKESAA